MNSKICAYFTLALSLISTLANAIELKKVINVEIDPQYVSFIPMNDRLLTTTGMKKIKLPDGKMLMCCIVYTPYKGDSALEHQKMITICRNKALAEIQRSRKCTVHAVKSLKTTMHEVSDGENVEYKNVSELLSVTKTEVYGVVSSWPVLGTWTSADKGVFYLMVGNVFNTDMKPIEIKND